MSMLELLDRPLPPSELVLSEDIGKDNRLSTAQGLASQDQLLPAAEAAKRIWEADIYDVRAIGYILCGAFLEQGFSALPRIGRCLGRCLTENWEQLKPIGQRGKHLGSALRWFFMTLHNQLAFCKFQNNAVWQECLNNAKLVSEVVEELEKISKMTVERTDISPFTGQLYKVVDLLLPYVAAAASPPPPAPEPQWAPAAAAPPPAVPEPSVESPPVPAAVEPPPKEPDFVLILDERFLIREGAAPPAPAPVPAPRPEPVPAPAPVLAAPAPAVSPFSPFAPTSPVLPVAAATNGSGSVPTGVCTLPLRSPLRWLLHQLRATSDLLRQRDFLRASVVIADVERSLDHMQPEMLLSDPLSEFWGAVAAHSDPLNSALTWAASEDRRARLWQRMYGLNPSGFAAEPGAAVRVEVPAGSLEAAALELPAMTAAPLPQLLSALRSASMLLSRGAIERAAVVIADLLPRLSRFDARQYLAAHPLLAAYYQAQADCAGELEQVGPQVASMRGQAMQRLYEMDPAAFLAEVAPSRERPPAPPELGALLLAQIDAIADLLPRGDSLRATVLVVEIEALLEIAPTAAPPSALRRFYALLLQNAAVIEEKKPQMATLKGRALRGLCRIDVSALLQAPI